MPAFHPAARFILVLAAVSLAGAALAGAQWSTSLSSISGKADENKEVQTEKFKLDSESSVKITYEVAANPENASPNVSVRLQRKLPNGSFVTIKTLSDLSENGETDAKQFPGGEYKMEVTATQAIFKVTAQKD